MTQSWRDIVLGGVVVLTLLALWLVFPLEKKLHLGLDLQGGMHLVEAVEADKLPPGTSVNDAVDRAIEIIRNRIDGLGVTEPVIQKQGQSWIVVQLPGIKDPERAKALIGQTALLEFKLVSEKPLDTVLDSKTGEPDPKKLKANPDLELVPGRNSRELYLMEKPQLMTGASLADANTTMDEYNHPAVSFEMTPEGSMKFGTLTSQHIRRQLAIILDGKVFSAPTIQSAIRKRGQITGSFTWDEARNLALVLRAGALPAPVKQIDEEVVGPSLGRDSIERGKAAAAIGTLLVLIFMAVYYRISGVIACVALILNFLYLLAILAALGATITLPGIAAMALTMGMSVDGNVLIFERIREELRAGKAVRTAVDNGYQRAWRTIWDSHVTTLITAGILYFLGSGPIRGFAVSLFWGVSISLATATIVTRAIFEIRKDHTSLSI